MLNPVTDVERIKGVGATITLANGREVSLRFDFAALDRIETEFGSIDGFAEAVDGEVGGTLFGSVLRAINCAIDRRDPPIHPEELADLLDTTRIADYRNAVRLAFSQAMPAVEELPAGKDEGGDGDSTGPSTGTPPPSPSDAPTPSSGQ